MTTTMLYGYSRIVFERLVVLTGGGKEPFVGRVTAWEPDGTLISRPQIKYALKALRIDGWIDVEPQQIDGKWVGHTVRLRLPLPGFVADLAAGGARAAEPEPTPEPKRKLRPPPQPRPVPVPAPTVEPTTPSARVLHRQVHPGTGKVLEFWGPPDFLDTARVGSGRSNRVPGAIIQLDDGDDADA